jgi:hypothetical protein
VIEIEKMGNEEWAVSVRGSVVTHHRVRVSEGDLTRLGEGRSAEELLRESFAFLLEREPNTAILASFDLPLIGRYFPEFEAEIRARLRRSS